MQNCFIGYNFTFGSVICYLYLSQGWFYDWIHCWVAFCRSSVFPQENILMYSISTIATGCRCWWILVFYTFSASFTYIKYQENNTLCLTKTHATKLPRHVGVFLCKRASALNILIIPTMTFFAQITKV